MANHSMQLDLDQLRNCFAEARSERNQLEQSIERSLDNVITLEQRLRHWYRDLSESNEASSNDRNALLDEVEDAKQQARDQHAEVLRLERELAETRQALSRHADTNERQETFNLEQQQTMQRLREECDKLRRETENTRLELESERQTAQELRAALEAAHENITGDLEARLRGINEELARTQGDLSQRNEAIHDLEQERTVLETELEMVRTRTAELIATLDQERKQMAEDRAEWSGELKQLRRLLERQARLTSPPTPMSHAPTSPSPEPTVELAANGSTGPRRDDPVVGSVLAQFDRIRQQRLAVRAAT